MSTEIFAAADPVQPAEAQSSSLPPSTISSVLPPLTRSSPASPKPPSQQAALARPSTRRPGDPPTRERKSKAVSYAQVDAARGLIKPQPLPRRRADKIMFEPDDTPADAERRIGMTPAGMTSVGTQTNSVNKKRPGPTPKSASQQQLAQQAQIKAVRASITPKPAVKPESIVEAGVDVVPKGAGTGPTLSDDEMEQIVALVHAKYGPVLDITQAAEVSKLAKQTIRERICHGLYADSVVRGRPLRFWAHRFVKEVMKP